MLGGKVCAIARSHLLQELTSPSSIWKNCSRTTPSVGKCCFRYFHCFFYANNNYRKFPLWRISLDLADWLSTCNSSDPKTQAWLYYLNPITGFGVAWVYLGTSLSRIHHQLDVFWKVHFCSQLGTKRGKGLTFTWRNFKKFTMDQT